MKYKILIIFIIILFLELNLYHLNIEDNYYIEI